jgi:hypothetical protein
MTNTFQQAVEHMVELCKYAANCPFTSDGVYDAFASELASAAHQTVIIAETTAGLDEALLESVQAACYHGEYGTGPEGDDYDELGFWQHVEATHSTE